MCISLFSNFSLLQDGDCLHFNEDSHHPVKGKNYETVRCTNLPNHPIFDRVKSIFIKELSSLKLTPPAKEILVEKGITIIAESRIGKGLVLAIGDPWFYNEYLDNRRLPVGFENYDAAVSVFRWLLANAKNIRKKKENKDDQKISS